MEVTVVICPVKGVLHLLTTLTQSNLEASRSCEDGDGCDHRAVKCSDEDEGEAILLRGGLGH